MSGGRRRAGVAVGCGVLAALAAGCAGEAAPADRVSASADTVPPPPIAAGTAPREPVTAATGEPPDRLGIGRPAARSGTPPLAYSARRATDGSTRAARRAGSHDAIAETPTTTAITTTSVAVSWGSTS